MYQDKVLIVGTGAIGGFYGALLAKSGADVSVVCRSDFEIVKQQSYNIKSDTLGQWSFIPSQVLQYAGDYQGQADYVILCTKITPEIDRIQLIKEAVSEKTCIVFIQNGVEVEQELIDAFPDNTIISGLAFICCNKINPGVIHHLAYGKLTLGNINNITNKTNNAPHLSALINQAGIKSNTSDAIISNRWLKCLWNAAFNPLSVLSDGLSTQDILNSQETWVRTIMQEVCTVAAACGHPLADNCIDINIKNTYAMPPYKTSMLLDFENHRTMEIEAILGNTIRAAQREKTACPTLEALYALMKLKELSILQQ